MFYKLNCSLVWSAALPFVCVIHVFLRNLPQYSLAFSLRLFSLCVFFARFVRNTFSVCCIKTSFHIAMKIHKLRKIEPKIQLLLFYLNWLIVNYILYFESVTFSFAIQCIYHLMQSYYCVLNIFAKSFK